MNLYINNIGERSESKDNVSMKSQKSRGNLKSSSRKLSNEGPFELDKGKLKKLSEDLMDAINRNNKEIFKY
jgi:hypothetical protein